MSAYDEARLLAATGRVEEARRALDGLLASQPAHLGALLLKAGLLLEDREAEAALALYRRASAEWEGSSEALNGLARCLHVLGRDQEALPLAERARDLLREPGNALQAAAVYLTLVWCLREMRKYREALAAAEEGLERCPDAVLAHWAGIVEEELAEAERERC